MKVFTQNHTNFGVENDLGSKVFVGFTIFGANFDNTVFYFFSLNRVLFDIFRFVQHRTTPDKVLFKNHNISI